jgi:two-component system response regulator RstA
VLRRYNNSNELENIDHMVLIASWNSVAIKATVPFSINLAQNALFPPEPRRVLLVEDSPRLASLIRDYMNQHGLELIVEHDGAKAVHRFLTERPALVILDIMLPGKDGYQICRELRAIAGVPILIYTARRDDIDHVLGLELGADDFVVKPLEPRVLLARVEALLRRTGADATERAREATLTLGDIAINRAARLVTFQGRKVVLTHADFDLFWELFAHSGHIVSRDQLQRVLRKTPYDGVGRAIDARVFRLRRRFEQAGAAPDLIVSVRSMGYLLAVQQPSA